MNGVSQQAPEARHPTQVEEMVNCTVSFVDGTRRRPPLEFIACLPDLDGKLPYFYSYERGDGEEAYIVAIIDGAWFVYDLDGQKVDSGTDSYLDIPSGAIPQESFASTTVGDTTFIVNKTKVVEESDNFTHAECSFDPVTNYKRSICEDNGGVWGNGISDKNYHKKFAYYWVKRTYIAYGGVDNQQASTYQYRIETNSGNATRPTDVEADTITGANAYGKNSLTIANTLAGDLNTSADPAQGFIWDKFDGYFADNFSFFDSATLVESSILNSNVYDPVSDTTVSYRLSGYFRPNTSGEWSIATVSDDSSWLWIGSAGETLEELTDRISTANALVDNSGLHSARRVTEQVTLAAGVYYPLLSYYGENTSSDTYYLEHKFDGSPSAGSLDARDWTGLAFQTTTDLLGDTSNSGSILRQLKSNEGYWHVSDTFGNQASEGWWGYIRKIQDLPEDMGLYEGVDTLIKVTGDEKNNFEGFWTTYSDGVWKESVQTGLKAGFKASTMPHTLVRTTLTDFTFKPYTFDERKVGDDFSNPMPSFVGHKIEDLFFYRNRLGMISQDSIILSEVGIYENFFRTTVTDLLASDTIDVAVDSNKVVSLKYAIPFKRNLLLFGSNAQYILSGENELRPDNVSISQSTEYQLNSKTKPKPIGSNTYFTVNKGEGTQVREYYNVPDSVDNIADDITAHVSDYIPKNAIDLEVSDKYDMIFILSSETGAQGHIYVYNQTWEGDKKAQSAWHRWEVGTANTNILAIRVLGDDLYLICHAGAEPEAVLKKISLARVDFANEDHRDLIDDPANSDSDPNNDTVAEYFSYIQLSEWGFNAGGQAKTDDKQGRLQVRKIELQTREGSEQKIQVQVGSASTTRKGDAAFVMGEAQKTKLTIKSVGNKGFCIDSVSLKGRYNSKSRTV